MNRFSGGIIMYEHYTRPSVDDIFAGKMSKYALAIAVAKRAREITDDYGRSSL